MTQRTKRLIAFTLTLAFAAVIALPSLTLAQGTDLTEEDVGITSVEESGLALSGGDVRQTAARLINVALGFLGIIALIIILLGGFKYMLSGGSEEKTTEARKLMISGIIGLVIILSAWAITTFVLSSLIGAVGE